MTYIFEKTGKLKTLTPEQLAAADADSAVIVLNKGILEDGTHYWAYVAVRPSRYGEFVRLTAAHEPLYLQDYGTILKCGLDEQIPDSIVEEMAREYGCDENYLDMLAEDVKKAQATFLKQQETQRIGDIVAMLKKKQGG